MHHSIFKKKLLLLATVNMPYIYIGRFGRFRFRGFNSVGFIAPASDCLLPSASQPQLSRSVPPAVRLCRHRSVLSAPVLVCTVLSKREENSGEESRGEEGRGEWLSSTLFSKGERRSLPLI